MATAWVLRGGGAFGAAQVGMARALIEAGHYPDLLYGTSAGALNAAALAAGPSLATVTHLEDLWARAEDQRVFPVRPWSLAAGLLGLSDHTLASGRLRTWLGQACPLVRLQDGAVPLTVVTTDIETGEMVLLDEGPAVRALMASSAIPGVFPPVRWQGRWLVDGSVATDTPLGPAVNDGATRVFVLPSVPMTKVAKPRSALDMVLRSSGITLFYSHVAAVREWAASCELFELPAPVVAGASAFSFAKTRELISEGHRVTSKWLLDAYPVSSSRGR